MIRVTVCGAEREYDSSLVSWIREQYHWRTADGEAFWFQVVIETDSVHLMLSSKNCPRRGGRAKVQVNQRERHVIDLWNDLDVGANADIEGLLRFLRKTAESLQ